MWLRTSCKLEFNNSLATPFVLMLRPRSGAQQWVAREEYSLFPSVAAIEFTDGYGNLCQRLIAPAGFFKIDTLADVRTADQADRAPGAAFIEIQYLPDAVLSYLLPSRYCESDCFYQMTTSITDGCQLGYDQVMAIENWLRVNIQYQPGSSNIPISAIEVNRRQSGVCRDLAHLGIAMCRSISIPARMVVGYLYGLQPMDMHAWFEAWIGNRWYTFDATQPVLSGGYVAIGYGRDAADVAVFNQFGLSATLTRQEVRVDLLPVNGE
jgi:transglutaminase-like putative cysteine protease